MRRQLILSGLLFGTLAGSTSASVPRHPGHPGHPKAAAATVATSAVRNAPAANSKVATPFVNDALSALAVHVTKQSNPDALRMAFQAYYNYKSAHPDQVRNPYFYFVDYGLNRSTPRGYVFDMQNKKLVDGPFIVAAGRGSAENASGVPTRFSNANKSAATSLGLYVTKGSYAFTGHSGGNLYSSIGLRLDGVSGQFNNNALARGVVVHGAPYVTATAAGRSQGCPAMAPARAQQLIPKLANGGLVFLFSPNDSQWMHNDPWANAAAH